MSDLELQNGLAKESIKTTTDEFEPNHFLSRQSLFHDVHISVATYAIDSDGAIKTLMDVRLHSKDVKSTGDLHNNIKDLTGRDLKNLEKSMCSVLMVAHPQAGKPVAWIEADHPHQYRSWLFSLQSRKTIHEIVRKKDSPEREPDHIYGYAAYFFASKGSEDMMRAKVKEFLKC